MKIGIRVDGGTRLGMGNIYRSLALADALSAKKHDIFFIMKGYPDSFNLIRDRSYPVFLLSPSTYNGSLNAQITQIVQDSGLQLLINDIKDTDRAYMETLKGLGLKVINFDDLGDGREMADLLFDAFYSRTIDFTPEHHNLGLDFIVLRDDFLNAMASHKQLKYARSIAVLMGGGNSGNFLIKVMKALACLPQDIEIHIILGHAVHNAELFQLDFDKKNFQYHYNPKNVAQLIAGADLAITAGGVSMCEACVVGTPTLVIPQVPHESINAGPLADRGAIVSLPYDPELNSQLILDHIKDLLNHPQKRKRLSQNAVKSVDGKGLCRILQTMSPHLQNN